MQTIQADVTSGLFELGGEWLRGGYDGDPFGPRYDRGTFIFTKTNGSAISFNFTGFEVDLIGAYRCNDGQYEVYLDDIAQGPFRATPKSIPPREEAQTFQQTLFSWTGEQGFHTVRLENKPIKDQTHPALGFGLDHVDIDYASWSHRIVSTKDVIAMHDEQDKFSYSNSWASGDAVPHFPDFPYGSAHVTTVNGPMDLSFTGERIALYGVTGKDTSPYIVELDGNAPVTFNRRSNLQFPFENRASELLYAASGLDANQTHNLRLTPDIATGQTFIIEYAVMDPVNDDTNGSSNGSSNDVTDIPSETGLSTAAKAGIGVGAGVLGLVLICIVFLIFRRRSQRGASAKRMSVDASTYTASTSSAPLAPSLIDPHHGSHIQPYMHHASDTALGRSKMPSVPPIMSGEGGNVLSPPAYSVYHLSP